MRKFLKQLRKGLRAACVTAALATCWNVGQSVAHAGYDIGDPVTIQFSGSISPVENNLSHVFLIYCTGTSSWRSAMNLVEIGDFMAGQTGIFSVTGQAVYNYELYCLVAGVYGDISGGEYIEGVNGVTFSESGSWIWSSVGVTEETMFDYLVNDNEAALMGLAHDQYYSYEYFWQLEQTRTCDLYDFSGPVANGSAQITTTIVPEPITILLFGSGGAIVLCRKRKSE